MKKNKTADIQSPRIAYMQPQINVVEIQTHYSLLQVSDLPIAQDDWPDEEPQPW